MKEKKHLLYRIQDKKTGIIFWSALPPVEKSEKLLEKRMLPVKENLRLSVSPNDVEFIREELMLKKSIRKRKLKKVM